MVISLCDWAGCITPRPCDAKRTLTDCRTGSMSRMPTLAKALCWPVNGLPHECAAIVLVIAPIL